MPKFGGRRIALRLKYYFNSNLIQRGGSNRVARAEHQIKRDTKISYCCKDTFFFYTFVYFKVFITKLSLKSTA